MSIDDLELQLKAEQPKPKRVSTSLPPDRLPPASSASYSSARRDASLTSGSGSAAYSGLKTVDSVQGAVTVTVLDSNMLEAVAGTEIGSRNPGRLQSQSQSQSWAERNRQRMEQRSGRGKGKGREVGNSYSGSGEGEASAILVAEAEAETVTVAAMERGSVAGGGPTNRGGNRASRYHGGFRGKTVGAYADIEGPTSADAESDPML